MERDMPGSVIVAGARTPIGILGGGLRRQSAMELGGFALQGALQTAGIDAGAVGAVVMGNAVQAGNGANPARQAAAAAGIPMDISALTVNKSCLSGLAAIALADMMITCGHHEVVLAGGMESMTNAPTISRQSAQGDASGSDIAASDNDELVCPFDGLRMEGSIGLYQNRSNVSRRDQDALAVRSHGRATSAMKAGRFDEEVVAVAARGEEDLIEFDESVRPGLTVEQLADWPTVTAGGTLTEATTAQPADGACALVVMSRERAERRGLPWLAEIVAYGETAGLDASPFGQAAAAMQNALRKAKLEPDDVDLFEVDEACACVAIDTIDHLGLEPDRVNVNGGSIALGNPAAMTGARVALTLALELRRRGGGQGLAALTGRGGQGDSMLIRVPTHR